MLQPHVQLHTELSVDNEDDDCVDLVRSHPCYRGAPWHDYVQVNWGEELGLLPARCALIFTWPEWAVSPSPENTDRTTVYTGGALCALVQDVHPKWQRDFQSKKFNSRFPKSILFDHYYLDSVSSATNLEARLSVIQADSITKHIFAINPNPEHGSAFTRPKRKVGSAARFDIIVAKDRKSEWPREFLTSYKLWRDRGRGVSG